MADVAEQIPQAGGDLLDDYGKQLLGVGLTLVKRATNTLDEADPDTVKVRKEAATDWTKIAMISGGVLVAIVVLFKFAKR